VELEGFEPGRRLNALAPMTAPTSALTSGRRLPLAFFRILSSKIVTMPKKEAAR